MSNKRAHAYCSVVCAAFLDERFASKSEIGIGHARLP
nr:MAG TPA: hypothetical protein [Caudoviricetes sp.]